MRRMFKEDLRHTHYPTQRQNCYSQAFFQKCPAFVFQGHFFMCIVNFLVRIFFLFNFSIYVHQVKRKKKKETKTRSES